MQFKIQFLLVCFITCLSSTIFSADLFAQWQMVGARKFTTGATWFHGKDMAVVNGTPYIAYSDNTDNFNLKVMKYNGTNWVDVGLSSLPIGNVGTPSITHDNGIIYVAYQDKAFSNKNSVIKFDGTTWAYVGMRGFSPDEGRFQSIAIYNGEPYVAFEDTDNSLESSVMKFDGTTWAYFGSPGFTTGHSVGQSIYNEIAFDGGIPYVIYMSVAHGGQGPPIYETKVMKHNGTAWVPLGNLGYKNAGSASQSIAFDNGEPYFSFLDESYYKATVKKFDGTNWVNVGTPGFSGDMAPEPHMVFHNGTPYVAYRDFSPSVSEKLTVMFYDGTNWVPLGGSIGVSPEGIRGPMISVDNGVLYAGFVDTFGLATGKITVMSYDLNVTNIEEIQEMNNCFQIHPNPASDLLTVTTEEEVEQVAILAMNGQLLKQVRSKTIDLHELPQGVYLLQIKTKNGIGHQRFVKE